MFKNILSIIIWIIITISWFFMFNSPLLQNKVLWADDWLRHIKFASYINEYWFSKNDSNNNWDSLFVNNIYNDYHVDLWQWHHIFLSLLLKLWLNDIETLKLYSFIILWIFFIIISIFNNKEKNPFIIWSFTFFILFISSSNELFRILLSRPFALTSVLFTLLIISLIYNKKLFIPFIFAIATYYHMVFYILFIPVIVYCFIYKENIKKIVLFSLLWTIIWIFLHTNSLNYLYFSFISFFYLPIIHIIKWFWASEILNSWIDLFLTILFIILLILNYVSYIEWNKNIFNKKNIFLITLTSILLILSIFISRFSDFLIPTFALSSIVLFSWYLKYENFDLIKFSKINPILLNLIVIIITIITLFLEICSMKSSLINLDDYKKFFTEIKSEIPKWSTIMSNEFLDFSKLYYFLWNDYKYANSMEIYYGYMKNKQVFEDIKDVIYSNQLEPKNKNLYIYDIFKKNWIQYYIILENKELSYLSKELLKVKIKEIENDKNFEKITQSNNNYLWKLK